MDNSTFGCVVLIISLGGLIAALYFFSKKPNKQNENNNSHKNFQQQEAINSQSQIKQEVAAPRQSPLQNGKEQPIFTLDGVADLLEVYKDRVEIVPRGFLGLMNKGVRGIKEIPYHSITAVQFKESGMMSGYLQFTIPGGNENRGGIMDATKDENTFMFAGKENNAKAIEIKKYISEAVKELRAPRATPAVLSIADELQKLANLKTQGLISEQEFQVAKDKLMK